MKNLIAIVALLLTATLSSCSSKQPEPKSNDVFLESEAAMMAPPPPPEMKQEADMEVTPVATNYSVGEGDDDAPNETVSRQILINKKKIIKDGNFAILTHDIASSKNLMDGLIGKLGSYYDNENMYNNDQEVAYDLKIRIPSASFEAFVSAIENGTDEIKGKNISARDVTEEFMDIESRLTNKREYLKKYKDLLNRAASVKDILAIQENIRVLQEEIESKEGRLKYLDDQVTYSTLEIHLFQQKEFVYKPQPQDKFSERVKNSLGNGWSAVVDFILGMIKAWPVIIVIVAVIFLIRRVIKRKRRKG